MRVLQSTKTLVFLMKYFLSSKIFRRFASLLTVVLDEQICFCFLHQPFLQPNSVEETYSGADFLDGDFHLALSIGFVILFLSLVIHWLGASFLRRSNLSSMANAQV